MDYEIAPGKRARQAYSFDDIAIVPSRRTRTPEEVSTSWQIDAYKFDLPLIAAPMDSVVSPETAIAIGKLGGLGVLNLEGLWTRYDDPRIPLGEIASMPDKHATRRMQEIYAAPIRPELIKERIKQIRDSGVTVAASLSPQRTAQLHKAVIDAGVDMLVLLTAGAGGNTGWINPFAFIEEVRSFWSGPLAVAGCVTTGRQVRAVQVAGADMAYIGTPFIATPESMASQDYKEALVAAGADDIVKTDAVTGIPANFLKSSLLEQGIMRADGSFIPKGAGDLASWKNAWSAGQGVASVGSVETVARRVEKLHQEWLQAT